MTLLDTDLLTAHDQTFRAMRHLLANSGLQEGVVAPGDYKVTPGAASRQYSVAAGFAWVQGDDGARQGLYPQVNDGAILGTVAAGHATLPRIDQVVLQIADSSVIGASDTPTIVVVPGTPTSLADLGNRNGAAALPDSALRLADILVTPGLSGTIPAVNIRDRRTWARGAFGIERRTHADITSTDTASFTSATIPELRLEIAAATTVRLHVVGRAQHSAAGAQVALLPWVDGAAPTPYTANNTFPTPKTQAANDSVGFDFFWEFELTAGSHLIGFAFRPLTAGTATITGSALNPLTLTVEEIVRQSALNE